MNLKGRWQKLETSLFSTEVNPSGRCGSESELVLATLNIGHGRGENAHQLFLRQADIRQNLLGIARALREESPHIVALQEADKAAFWSAMEDQIECIATTLGMPYGLHGDHMSRQRLKYGTALVSHLAIDRGYSYTFSNRGLLPPKGYVYGRVHLRGERELKVHVVSVHLDFAGRQTRHRQISDLIAYLEKLDGPVVVMGDFNSEWSDRISAVEFLGNQLNLSAFMPESKEHATFPRTGKRWDWILISQEFEFVDYKIHPEELSDHRLVISRVRLKG